MQVQQHAGIARRRFSRRDRELAFPAPLDPFTGRSGSRRRNLKRGWRRTNGTDEIDPGPNRPPFHVIVDHSVARLAGDVRWEVDRRRLDQLDGQVPGVLRVVNDLQAR